MKRYLLLLSLLGLSCAHPATVAVAVPAAVGQSTSAQPETSPDESEDPRVRARIGTRGMVVSADEQASEWGAEILRRGGNAVDAAVATAFALAVTRPSYASLGGGGFLLYCPHPTPKEIPPCQVIDYREQAPSSAVRDMFIRGDQARTDLSQAGALASGVPGVPAGLLMALEKFGTLPRAKLLSGPIDYARNGFKFTGFLEEQAKDRWGIMNPEARKILSCGHLPRPCAPGEKLKQPDLARVLTEISKKGAPGFYSGWVADKIADAFDDAGGILDRNDLAHYKPVLREPVHARYRDSEIVSMPPPSAGGTMILEMLGYSTLAEKTGEFSDGFGSTRTIHALTHAMSLAFADRAHHFGDPDQITVPVAQLLDPAYLERRWSQTFNSIKAAIPSGPGTFANEGAHTTHLSVMDREGNAVAITTTINNDYGSGFVPPGTGIVMNDEMDDFSLRPGVPNLFGLIGDESNAIAPKKRPLSSMSPTVVRDLHGNNRMVLGAAGGPTITTSVFLTIFNRLRFGMTLQDALAAPRFHHQWKPETLTLERFSFPTEIQGRLTKMGYTLDFESFLGRVQAVERFPDTGRTAGVPDPREEGYAAAE